MCRAPVQIVNGCLSHSQFYHPQSPKRSHFNRSENNPRRRIRLRTSDKSIFNNDDLIGDAYDSDSRGNEGGMLHGDNDFGGNRRDEAMVNLTRMKDEIIRDLA
ncbi:hypothetical protein U1Q18_016973 [Sarracenia purpurea var. burkii]